MCLTGGLKSNNRGRDHRQVLGKPYTRSDYQQSHCCFMLVLHPPVILPQIDQQESLSMVSSNFKGELSSRYGVLVRLRVCAHGRLQLYSWQHPVTVCKQNCHSYNSFVTSVGWKWMVAKNFFNVNGSVVITYKNYPGCRWCRGSQAFPSLRKVSCKLWTPEMYTYKLKVDESWNSLKVLYPVPVE